MLKNKNIVVTGGGSGIGKACVEEFCKSGATVIMIDFNQENLDSLKRNLESEKYNIDSYCMDVGKEENWVTFSKYIEENYKKIDGVFNNAGFFELSSIEDTTEKLWDKTLDVNSKGVFFGIKYLYPFMKDSGNGSIVNAGSIASKIGSKDRIAYAASKGAVEALTKAAAIELAPYGIRVNSTHPPYVNTNMAKNASVKTKRSIEEMGKRIPLGNRICEPEEVAKLVKFLLSDDSSFITGAQLVIDGGQITN